MNYFVHAPIQHYFLNIVSDRKRLWGNESREWEWEKKRKRDRDKREKKSAVVVE